MLRLLALAGATLLIAGFGVAPVAAAPAPSYKLAVVGAYGGEPSLISDSAGVLYDTTPSGLTVGGKNVVPIYRSTDKGSTWTRIQEADTTSGDDCLGVDQARDLYWCNLASTSQGVAPLQADDWRSTVASTCTTSCGWLHGAGVIPGLCSTSCNPFGVDRQWTAASIPPGQRPDQGTVVLMYHDFYGPSQIWVNISHDGGHTFGAPQEVLASPAVTPGAITGTLVAEAYTFCNTVPAGVQIVPNGKPHAGRIYVGWIAADLPQNATGCNITMLQSFHTLWVSYSDDGGQTWTPQQAVDMGIGHDMSTPFVAMTLDADGNPYFAFASEDMSQNPATCAVEGLAGTQGSDSSCAYNLYLVWSNDGGSTWDGGGGVVPGSAAQAYRVNSGSEIGTHVFPAVAAGLPGQVVVGSLFTPEIEPTDPLGKFDPGGCAGPGPANGNPPTYPATCDWYVQVAQSADLAAGPTGAHWTSTRATPKPMHFGDICNLGIFCVFPTSNRHLADYMMAAIDPTTGCAHIAYADDNAGTIGDPANPSPTGNHLMVANQTSDCLAASVTRATHTPPTLGPGSPLRPLAGLLIGFGALLLALAGVLRVWRPRKV